MATSPSAAVSVDLLRRAAEKIRKRAAEASKDWRLDSNGCCLIGTCGGEDEGLNSFVTDRATHPRDRDYVASWHPAVALAVANWLDDEAAWQSRPSGPLRLSEHNPALIVARVYLGEPT